MKHILLLLMVLALSLTTASAERGDLGKFLQEHVELVDTAQSTDLTIAEGTSSRGIVDFKIQDDGSILYTYVLKEALAPEDSKPLMRFLKSIRLVSPTEGLTVPDNAVATDMRFDDNGNVVYEYVTDKEEPHRPVFGGYVKLPNPNVVVQPAQEAVSDSDIMSLPIAETYPVGTTVTATPAPSVPVGYEDCTMINGYLECP